MTITQVSDVERELRAEIGKLKALLQEQPAPKVVDCHAKGVCVQSGLRAEEPSWSGQIGRLIGAANYAASKGLISGTTNWAATVAQLMMASAPQPARKPLTNHQTMSMTFKHHWLTSLTLRDAYRLGIRDAEAAHGITGEQK